jgi:hypothetical protein
MGPGFAAAALLACLPLGARAGNQPDEKEPRTPVHVAAMVGLISLPRPIDVEVLVRIGDLFGIGFGYSDFPAFVANPPLDLAGAKSGTTDARLDQTPASIATRPAPCAAVLRQDRCRACGHEGHRPSRLTPGWSPGAGVEYGTGSSLLTTPQRDPCP